MLEVCLSSHVDPCREAFKQNFLPLTSQVCLLWLYVCLVLMSTNHVSMTFFLRARLVQTLR